MPLQHQSHYQAVLPAQKRATCSQEEALSLWCTKKKDQKSSRSSGWQLGRIEGVLAGVAGCRAFAAPPESWLCLLLWYPMQMQALTVIVGFRPSGGFPAAGGITLAGDA